MPDRRRGMLSIVRLGLIVRLGVAVYRVTAIAARLVNSRVLSCIAATCFNPTLVPIHHFNPDPSYAKSVLP